ncbi:AraC family transcriptional regulator [Cellvibrio zantedeschiae]|uniref:AraC family transcriptional regulator n=1 Tax=Cellvibrio zantedeschiae TaxID=1237077 RepID=A0ABQ3B778_9GAMM|nr:AraC family transcriptional regulator [Cellvibrio zantedeschiae]GGY76952.1 AraC family transcriptional regulator [Cellvibrio zantedeschiae]
MLGSRRFTHKNDYTMGLHSHAEGQFFMLLRGTAVYITEQGEWLMTPMHPCWVPPKTAHGVRSRGEIEGIAVIAGEEYCDGLPREMSIIKTNQLIHALLEKMSRSEDDSLCVQHLWAVLKDEILQAEYDDLHLPVPQDERLRALTQLIVENPADSRSLEQWAAKVNLAERTLIRKFRAETGMSLVAWRQRARVIQAIRLLNAGSTVTDTALSVGYDSLSAFISVFKQITGVSPMQYLQSASPVSAPLVLS